MLLLAILGMIFSIAAQAIISFGWTPLLLDWRLIAGIVVLGALAGIVGLYLVGCLLNWSARPFGGKASMTAIRAALAWGGAPSAIGIPIALIAVLALMRFAHAAPPTMLLAFQVIVGLLGFWSLLGCLAMVSRVEHFGILRTIVAFAIACLALLPIISLLIRTVLFQPFNIPAGSMMPTLLVGDDVFVAKYAYGYSRYSLPLSPPLFGGRILASAPQRGDVVVFRLPKDPSVDYIKRVVGLPGDRIQMVNDVLQINGQPVKHEPVDDFVTEDGGKTQRIKRFRDTLPNGVSYTTLVLTGTGPLSNTTVFTVPPGSYFMLGDNLDNSTDSRLPQVGYVPFENLIGRAARIYFSVDTSRDGQPELRLDRIGTAVR